MKQKVTGRRVVETIPARNQNCRANYISSIQQEMSTQTRERVDEEKQGPLQSSYNSWGEEGGSRSGQRTRVERNMDTMSMTQVWKTVNNR